MNMKSISISITEKDENLNKDYIIDDDLLKYIVGITAMEYQYINFVWICHSDYNRIQFLKRVKRYQKRISRTKHVTIHNTVRIVNRFPDKRLKKFCTKNKIELEAEFDNALALLDILTNVKTNYKIDVITVVDTYKADLINIYNLVKKHCFTLKFKQNFIYLRQFNQSESEEYVVKLKELFDYWIKDKNTVFIKPFADHIRSAYQIAAGKECINSSCLGKTLNIDSNGRIYLCSQSQNDKYNFGNFKNFSLVSEIFQSEIFTKLVENMIEMRKNCIANCTCFKFCQGGCCTCVNTYGMCRTYCEIVKSLDKYISNTMQDIVANNKTLNDFNPVLLKIVKEIISYNPASLVIKN